jgi:hypothetical protein
MSLIKQTGKRMFLKHWHAPTETSVECFQESLMVDVCHYIFRAFDVELLYIAQRLNIPITEVAVNWQEIDGMKLFEM